MSSHCFSDLSDPARSIWAKSGEPQGHGLLAHMLDVAAVALTLLEHESPATIQRMAAAFGLPVTDFPRTVAALVGLHDFGKAIPGFQCKWEQGRQRVEQAGLAFHPQSLRVADHAMASGALLDRLLRERLPDPDWRYSALQAISAHHGYNIRSERDWEMPAFEAAGWATARQLLLDAYWTCLQPVQPSAVVPSLPAVEWLAGLTSISDWIGSNPEWFPLGERADELDSHFAAARHLATQALQAIGWPAFDNLLQGDAPTEVLLGQILGRCEPLTPRPLQEAAERLLAGNQGPALLLVEAPMGEGKTELAFLAHLRLQRANGHRGLYVALPTQATGNALYERALTFLRAFADERQLDIQLVHGGAMLDERVEALRDQHRLQGIHDDSERHRAAVTASSWFSRRRRPLLSPYGVGTVDQSLLAVLNVKHHFVRLWGLANRVVVLDEVHAYDTYTSQLIENLLRWLRPLGASVVLMSATLPAARQRALLQAWGVQDEVPPLAYPRLLLADARGVQGETFESRQQAPIQLHPVGESLSELAALALCLLEVEGHGAVIVNTVQRAQQLYRLLQQQGDGIELLLFHARFPADERSARERQVLATFGKYEDQPPRTGRVLLIATQVAEQSLDIDFDFLISDLAPVDLILQRAGRLHRHQRVRPADHAQPRLWVAGLSPERLPEMKETAWEFVYDLWVLARSWAFLSQESELQLPGDIDRLVQRVYDDSPLPPELAQDIRDFIDVEAMGRHLGKQTDQSRRASNIVLDAEDEPQSAYADKPRGNEEGEGQGLVNQTRLGEDSITLIPLHQLAAGWSLQSDGEVFDPQQALPPALARTLYARQLKCSRKALVAHCQQQSLPPAFSESPLLCHAYPLLLQDGRCQIGRLLVQLDPELGLLYSTPETSIDREEE